MLQSGFVNHSVARVPKREKTEVHSAGLKSVPTHRRQKEALGSLSKLFRARHDVLRPRKQRFVQAPSTQTLTWMLLAMWQ